MTKKLTITLDEAVYEGLYRVVGPRRISRFIEQLVRPHVIDEDLEAAYAEMAQDEERETEALEWSDALINDVSDETRRSLVGQFRSIRRWGNPEEASGDLS